MKITFANLNISFQVNPSNSEEFWGLVQKNHWEPDTYAVFHRCIDATTLVVDFGAWIGPTCLYSAQLGEVCLAFEPDPVAFEMLKENFVLNKGAPWARRLKIFNEAITSDGAPVTLGSNGELGDSMSSQIFSNSKTTWTVSSRTIAAVLNEYRATNQSVFLKIDVEGAEYELIPTIQSVLIDPLVSAQIALHPEVLEQSLHETYKTLPFFVRWWWVRFLFVWQHWSILTALPTGERVVFHKDRSRLGLMLRAFLFGRFPHSVLILRGAAQNVT